MRKAKSHIFASEALRTKIKKTPSPEDIVEADFVLPALDKLNAEYNGWQAADGHGTHKLWDMLGFVHELSHQIDANPHARLLLEGEVGKEETVREDNRWSPERKSSQDLLLTKLLGLRPETKASKSQWLGALRQARKSSVPDTQRGFTDWIKEVGGIGAARKLGRKDSAPKPKDLKSWIGQLDGFDPELEAITIPDLIGDDQFPEGFGIVIVQATTDGKKFKPIASVADERAIVAAIRSLIAQATKLEAENRRGFNELVRSRLREQKKLWRKEVNAGRYEGPFDDFVHHGLPGDESDENPGNRWHDSRPV